MLSITTILGINLILVAVFMFVGWLISLIHRNVTIVDSLWGLGFVFIAWATFLMADGFGGRSLLLCLLVTFWGLRLSMHLSWRNWGEGEDPRYGKWRAASGERFWIVSLFKVFLLQAVVLWVIALNMQIGLAAPAPERFTVWDFLGVFVWAAGFAFETVADWQLARFKADDANRGRVMDKGLWAVSRHPNYFGEVLVWWGIFLVTLSQPANVWTVISPVLITLVVLKMTGIPLTETHLSAKRPDYDCYRLKTSAFIPWFPRKEVICEYVD